MVKRETLAILLSLLSSFLLLLVLALLRTRLNTKEKARESLQTFSQLELAGDIAQLIELGEVADILGVLKLLGPDLLLGLSI